MKFRLTDLDQIPQTLIQDWAIQSLLMQDASFQLGVKHATEQAENLRDRAIIEKYDFEHFLFQDVAKIHNPSYEKYKKGV